MAKMGGGVQGLFKTVVEAVFIVVAAGALFPVLTDAIANMTGIPVSAATVIGLLPLFLGLAIAYRLITSAIKGI